MTTNFLQGFLSTATDEISREKMKLIQMLHQGKNHKFDVAEKKKVGKVQVQLHPLTILCGVTKHPSTIEFNLSKKPSKVVPSDPLMTLCHEWIVERACP